MIRRILGFDEERTVKTNAKRSPLIQWRVVALGMALLATGCNAAEKPSVTPNPAKALFEEKCRTVAGEKIYKTVKDVEGVLLMKVRPERSERDLADLMWPGAAFAREFDSDSYIRSFLGYEYAYGDGLTGKKREVTPQKRGYINTDKRPDGLPGYRYVDVIDPQDGKRYRYTGSEKVVGKKDINAPNVKAALSQNPNYDLNVYRWTLDKILATAPAPRYGVTYEDHVIPEERRLGIASSTVKVIDLKTNEVLGEMTRYAWGETLPSSGNPRPWLTANKCPSTTADLSTMTRQFADQILIPKGRN